ncbi:hypothetical protein WICPIJ_006629 [Wickerhamomyces pijperi]|uniref:Uncharacterized protein n=1 Tax=Wickerhamomyces pijperi TaxID=599730 RepID=A0A9P8Q3W8_WICPI|nr:hypothetical protein WICPIJ_006629 [Wickerhamomyces pijperi]
MHENEKITGDGSDRGNKSTHPITVVQVQTIGGDKTRFVVQTVWQEERQKRLINTISHVSPELGHSPFRAQNTNSVKLRNQKRDLGTDILIENTHEDNWKRSVGQVVEHQVGILEQIGTIELTVDPIPEQSQCENDILVEKSRNHLSNSLVRPSTMNQD